MFGFLSGNYLEAIITVGSIIIGIFQNKILKTNRDRQRAELLDKIAESTLALIMINSTKDDLLKKIDYIKDRLVEKLLEQTSNKEVAERVAANAINKVVNGK